jgi:hypothetical protein
MLYTAEKQPAVFFATCARLLPNNGNVRAICMCATLSDFTGYEDAGNSGAAGTGMGPCSASNARPLVARLRGVNEHFPPPRYYSRSAHHAIRDGHPALGRLT